jgi:predicted Zn-dependent peptidase
VIDIQETETDLVGIQVFVRSAPEEDPSERGIGEFVSMTLLSGSRFLATNEMQAEIGRLGGNVTTQWDPDFTQIKVLTLASVFHKAAWLVSDVLKDANFPDQAVEDSRKTILSDVQSHTDNLFGSVYDRMQATLYAGTPRADLVQVDPEAIAHMRREQLLRYYSTYFVPRNIVIAVVGNVDPANVEHEFRTNLADFPRIQPRRPMEVPSSSITILDKPVTVKKYRSDLTAAYIMAGYLAPGSGSTDFVPMQVANALLGGMKTSRLFTDLREKQGYGYEVASTYTATVSTGNVAAYIVTTPTRTDASGKEVSMISTVRDALLDEVKAFRESKPTEADLARAKRFLIGAHAIAHERIEQRAYFLGYSEIAQAEIGGYNFDTHYEDAVNAVNADDVQRVSKQYLTNGAVISMLLPGDPNAGVISK